MLPSSRKAKKRWKTQVRKQISKKHLEAKTYRFGSHLGAILAASWGTWEAFGGLLGHLGANLKQHKPILRHLGANLGPS